MSHDPTESARREMLESGQPYRDLVRAEKRWTTAEMQAEFTVVSFLAPLVVVVRKSDGVKGTMEFTHSPRFYFDFVGE
jgi:hypothetical protein